MNIEWKVEYETTNPIIDEQHKFVFMLINNLLKATTKKELVYTTMELYKYIRYHFKYEESLMRYMKAGNYEEHVNKHNDMITKLNLVSEQIANDALDKVSLDKFIIEWTIDHIGTECMELKKILYYSYA